MVYVAQDGSIQHGPRPWGLRRLTDTFWSIVGAVELFFQTLIPFSTSSAPNRAINFRSSSGTTSSSSRRNNPSGRRGGFRTMSDIAPPPPAFGGCSGGSCGM